MKEEWKKNIDNLDIEQLYKYLTIERGNYKIEAIKYAENTLIQRKISLIELQKTYNYNQSSNDTEITRRILNKEPLDKIKQDLEKRNLSKYTHLIKEKHQFLKEMERKKKRNSQIRTNVILSLIFSSFFIKRTFRNPNIIDFFIVIIFPFLLTLVLSILIETVKLKTTKNHKFNLFPNLFPNLFYKLWLYLILFLLASLIIPISTQ
ncbi:hypothetical protein MC378_06700 [Polaribacter sp. MSW13]|uniref:Uncharacterized protein n=1 Tax=Polaribacter marinus TaxID=2916838 RepID=A0A9X2AJA9_9FLAO|nr:hypothetical protein [Polaribacter marinus]MCI2228852.1 hypothetical protein [Polaribacter marinus]